MIKIVPGLSSNVTARGNPNLENIVFTNNFKITEKPFKKLL
jgi:hypothetical protein